MLHITPRPLFLLLLAVGAAAPTRAQTPSPAPPVRIVGAAAVVTAPTLDGRLDEAVWAGAAVADSFVQRRPDPGKPGSQRTEARVVYTPEALYVAMRMFDADPRRIAAPLVRRDEEYAYSDWAQVVIDSYHDRRTAFRFGVNPRGVQNDVLHSDDTSEDRNWDAVWEVATRVDSLGWTAEFRIPLSQLRFTARAGEQVWGINFGRKIARNDELSWWSPILPELNGFVSRAGELRGLRGLRSTERFEVLPYTRASLARAPGEAADPFYRRSDPAASVGADVRYRITSNLTLSATLNPDFGQVEADPSQVNLSDFEAFFPERRPFFMEGSNIFSYGVGVSDGSGEGLFYSRRIGRQPQRGLEAADGGFVDAPSATTILAAAKLSGKTSTGWTVGILDAVTNREEGLLSDPGMPLRSQVVEPLTNYLVSTVSRDFREGRSSIGVMTTATHRDLEGDEGLAFLRSSAYSGVVTGRHRFAGDRWEVLGFAGGSHVRGSEEAITRVQHAAGHYFHRPDAAHVEVDSSATTLSGAVFNLLVMKQGGGPIRGGVGAHLRTPGLELNDLGYQQDADSRIAYFFMRHQQDKPLGIFRRFSVGVNPSVAYTTAGERTWTQIGHNANWTFNNLWGGGWWVGKRFEALSVSALRGGPAILVPGHLRYNGWLRSDNRKRLSGVVETWGSFTDATGSRDRNFWMGTDLRAASRLTLGLTGSYHHSHDTWGWVGRQEAEALGTERFVFADLDQRTARITARVGYAFSPKLSLAYYAQPFASAGRYTAFQQVADPRAERWRDRLRPFGEGGTCAGAVVVGELCRGEDDTYRADVNGDGREDFRFDDPDFSVREFRSNAVARWEYRPGSTVFVVWSQGRSGNGTPGAFSLRRDVGTAIGVRDDLPTENVLLIKVNYWLNF